MAESDKLKNQLRAMIEADSLSDDEFAQLPGKEKADRGPVRGASLWLSLAAGLMVAFSLWLAWPAVPDAGQPVLARIAEEVRVNHVQVKPLDVEASTYESLRSDMSLLDFVLQAPMSLTDMGALTLVGGRYCTLQGVLATQLVFEDSDGQRVTMYQAGYDARRFGAIPDLTEQATPAKLSDHGLDIQVWRQEGVVLALARAAY